MWEQGYALDSQSLPAVPPSSPSPGPLKTAHIPQARQEAHVGRSISLLGVHVTDCRHGVHWSQAPVDVDDEEYKGRFRCH